jgi:acyl-CoA synthetase (AMP-forming)/AMP-acid ligase II
MTDPNAPTLAARSALHARHRPEHVAIICEDREVTYGELHRASNRTANALLAAGLGAGTRVAYLGRDSEHYYDLALGCAKTGTVLVPVNWRLTAGEIDHILRDSGAGLLFVEREYAAAAQRVAPELPTLRAVVAMDTGQERAAGFRAWRGDQPDTDPGLDLGPDDPVVQIYTSGTTGLPKGAVLANRAYFTFIENMARHGVDWIDWLPGDRSLVAFPGMHVAGMSWFMHGFTVGVTNVIVRMFVAEEAVRLIERIGITTTFVAPAMLKMMLSERGAGRDTFRSLRKVVYGASPISQSLLARCLEVIGCEFAQMYSSTETGSVAACLPPADHVPGSPLLRAAGRACPGNELKVIDGDGSPLPPGLPGQVCVRLSAGFLGYWNQPEATAGTLVDGWIRMGDIGYLDEDGYLYLCDRVNDTIIVAGQNIYPAEVENALAEHPAVAEAAVVGMPDERWGEVVCAWVVLDPGQRTSGRQLLLFLRGRLADYKIPTRYEFVDTLPRNPTGKLLRRVLRERLAHWPSAPPVPAGFTGPAGQNAPTLGEATR